MSRVGMVGGVPPADKVHLPLVHRLLWNRANSRHRVTFRLDELGSDLMITKHTMSRVVNALIRQKRITKLSGQTARGSTYIIKNPDGFSDT